MFRILKKEFTQASKLFEQPLMYRDYFDNLADSCRSPHIWRHVDGKWQLRRTVWQEEAV